MTKGVSIVTGQHEPLTARVVRSRKNKDLLALAGRFGRDGFLAVEAAANWMPSEDPESHSGTDIPVD
jgi:hypothetical protein